MKAATPFSSVVSLDGLMLIRFFPALFIFADTFLFATGQPPASVTVNVTTLFSSLKAQVPPYLFQQFLPFHHTRQKVAVTVQLRDKDIKITTIIRGIICPDRRRKFFESVIPITYTFPFVSRVRERLTSPPDPPKERRGQQAR